MRLTNATAEQLMTAVHDIALAETVEACVVAIETHARTLFAPAQISVAVGGVPDAGHDPAVVALQARDRHVGALQIRGAAGDPEVLAAFARHAGLALSNLMTLAERDARARRDPLTGLLNHREFHDALDVQLARVARDPRATFALVVFDLNRFKLVNDRLGHAAGDRALRTAASTIASACRAGEAAFRIGGDEFAVVLPDADRDAAAAVGRRAAAAIERVAHRDGAAFGVAAWPGDGTTADTLRHVADGALRHHKRPVGPSRAASTAAGAHAAAPAGVGARTRLAVAARLATKLAPLAEPREVAAAAVDELHEAFGFFLAVIQRLDADGVLRVLAAAGPLAGSPDFLAYEQPVDQGINGRVARTGRLALIADTGRDPDYLRRDPRSDPGSELSLPIISDGRIWGVMNLEQLATNAFGDEDVLLADTVAAQVGAALHRCALTAELEQTFANTLGVLADALETKDAYTARHADEVSALSVATGRRLGLAEADLKPLRYCALLHDIGKIGIRSEVLAKPGRLTEQEFEHIKEHSAIGDALLRRIPLLTHVAPLVRAVHERFDGGGYPDGLAADAIPLAARIVAVCDALHAMTSDRPYRAALSRAAAVAELRRCAGAQFDPEVVRAVLAVSRDRGRASSSPSAS